MTDPLFYSAEVTGALPEQVIALDADTSSHAIRSQRLTANHPVLVSDGVGTIATGSIQRPDPKSTSIRINSVTVHQPPKIHINLVQALAKADRDMLAAEMATEIGVDSVTPWQAQRSIVRLRSDLVAKTKAKWQAKLQAAAQQSRRAYIPELREPIIGEQITQLHTPAKGHHVLVLHEEGNYSITEAAATLPQLDTLHIVVGPEGGVSPEELAAVRSVGAAAVQIGHNIMRASTAGPVAIALLNEYFNRW